MKRILAFLLLFVFCFSSGVSVFAEEEQKNGADLYEITNPDFSVKANSAILMEAKTGKILYAQNETHAASPASVTKIMTLLLVMEAIDSGKISLDDKVTVSANAASMGGSQVFLKEGEEMLVRDLIKCTVIASANDASVALAEHTFGSEEAFVRAMNKRAEELGMSSTSFENTTGLDDTTRNHVSSALDIAIMSRELISHNLITEYSSMWQDTIRDGEFTLTNTNRLVRYYDGCNGLKTGSTDKAGYCISVTAKRNNTELIAVVMGAESRDVRNETARTLLDYGFSSYALYSREECEIESIPVRGGTVNSVKIFSRPFESVIDKNHVSSVDVKYEIPEYVTAPISSGSVIGKLTFEIEGKRVGECEVYVKDEIPVIGLFEIFKRILTASVTGNSEKD